MLDRDPVSDEMGPETIEKGPQNFAALMNDVDTLYLLNLITPDSK